MVGVLNLYLGISRLSIHSVEPPCLQYIADTLVGVLAHLCSHLREMTGLTIRATVSQLDCATNQPGCFTSARFFTTTQLPPSSPAKRRRSAIPNSVSVAFKSKIG